MEINLWAVLVGAVVGMIIGSIWFGPLFGKKYMQEMGMDSWSEEKRTQMKKCMMWSYLGQFIASLVTFYVLAWFIGSLNQMTAVGGATIGALVWIGFSVPNGLSKALWGGKMSLFWLGIVPELITLLAVGAIIGAW